MDLMSMLQSGSRFRIEVDSEDLLKFADALITKSAEQRELELTARKQSEREEEWLTTEQVCKMCHCCTSTIWAWEKRGYLIPSKIGGRKRFAAADIRKLLERPEANGIKPQRVKAMQREMQSLDEKNASPHPDIK